MDNNYALWLIAVVYVLHFSPTRAEECVDALGLKNGNIPDNKMTASSETANKESYRGRLGNDSAWCARVQDSNQYLQVDLGQHYFLTGITTQGFSVNSWVTKYTLSFSQNGQNWTKISSDGNTNPQEFTGNTDSTSTKEHTFNKVRARYFRFNPVTYNTAMCARLELYGCDTEESSVTVVLIVCSVIAGIFFIVAIAFLALTIKRHLENKRSEDNEKYMTDDMGDMFEVKVGGKHENLSDYAAADAAGYVMEDPGLKGLNWKLTKVEEDIRKSQDLNRQTAEKVASKAKNYSGRKTNQPSEVPFDQSTGATALDGEATVKRNPLFSDSAC